MTQGIDIARGNASIVGSTIRALSMTSRAKSQRIAQEGSWSQAVSADNTYTKTFSHSLGYKAAFRVYGETFIYAGEGMPLKRIMIEAPSGSAGAVYIYVYITTTQLVIEIGCSADTPTTTINGYYYIFEEAI